MLILPGILKRILHKIMEDIKSNARFKLCEDLKLTYGLTMVLLN